MASLTAAPDPQADVSEPLTCSDRVGESVVSVRKRGATGSTAG